MVVAILLAGGSGQRLGVGLPKQFVSVLGKPIIVYTLERLSESPLIDSIVVVCVESYINNLRDLVHTYQLAKVSDIVPGGSTFGLSFRRGVDSLDGRCAIDDVILLHMASSPLVPLDVIDDVVTTCATQGNAFSAVPSYACMCQMTGPGFSDKELDRNLIFGLMTPQAVQYGKLVDLYQRADDRGYDFHNRQHLSTLMSDMGERMFFAKSSPLNIKITTQDDLALVSAYLSMKHGNPSTNTTLTEWQEGDTPTCST